MTHQIQLTREDLDRLDSVCPESAGSAQIGRRAEEIAKIHFLRQDSRCTFSKPSAGADLRVLFSASPEPLLIEIKGTVSSDIGWQKLKVSSQHSWRSLAETGMPVYRVCGVFSASPTIQVLTHGVDFVLEKEDRWTFKRLRVPVSSTVVDRQPVPPKVEAGSQSSKYDALRQHLNTKKDREITIGFAEMARILGSPLPMSAYKYPAFWANQANTTNRPWARAWHDAGYAVDGYRLGEHDGWVRFRSRTP